MDILYSNQVDIFCLVSSDSDFTRLAMRLREAGKEVIGMGMKQTPKPFIAACNKFIYLEVLSFSLEPEQIKTISPEPASIVEGKSVPASGEGEKQQIENVPELTIKQETVPAFLSNIGEAVDSVANDSGGLSLEMWATFWSRKTLLSIRETMASKSFLLLLRHIPATLI